MIENFNVSVLMITYNHERYVSKAIESVLMQKTNFEVELIIGEDCSSDMTMKICQKYALKFPSVRLLPIEPNQGFMSNFIRTLQACTGKYAAILEGDDYWIETDKLQKQVNFLETNPDYSMCFTDRMIVDANDKILYKTTIAKEFKKHLDVNEIIGGFTPPTQTVLFRSSYLENEPKILEQLRKVYNGDTFLFSFLATKGKVGYIDILSAAYRMNDSGIYSNLDNFSRLRERLNTYKILKKSIPQYYHNFILKGYIVTLQRLFALSLRNRKVINGLKYFCLLILLDIKFRKISTVRAIRLLFKSIFSLQNTITD